LVRRIRQNHAIEHGTIAVLLERGTPTPLAGYGTTGGFFIYARTTSEEITSAAKEALGRMQGGERELAVSPYCGTNMAVGMLLSAAVVGIILGRSRMRRGRLPLVALGVAGSMWLRRPVGDAVQRHLTTLSDVDDVAIIGSRRFQIGRHAIHIIRTALDGDRA
jgi:hypothetical protein